MTTSSSDDRITGDSREEIDEMKRSDERLISEGNVGRSEGTPYVHTAALERMLHEVVSGTRATSWDQVTLASDILEAFGEMEHDPSLAWPELFEGGYVEHDVIEQRLLQAVGTLANVFAYVVAKRTHPSGS